MTSPARLTIAALALLAATCQPAHADDWRLERIAAPERTAYTIDVAHAIDQTAARYRVSASLMRLIAWCESRYEPGARNLSGAAGLFQFIPSTWARAASGAGVWWASPFEPAASIEAAAWLLRADGAGHWQACLR